MELPAQAADILPVKVIKSCTRRIIDGYTELPLVTSNLPIPDIIGKIALTTRLEVDQNVNV
ncbi:hypothetical protein DRO34_05265 [Candidatus Bathyarchaeota archaeon]|nr:MAG: hypothetical protein DRO34_05265 [Candidatus Bathyarchaeota archaeon]